MSQQATQAPYEHYSHPGWGVDIQGVFASFRHAEQGRPRQMCDLIDDRTRADAKWRGMQLARFAAVTGRAAMILPGGSEPDDIRAAEMLRASLERNDIDLTAYIEHATASPLKYGWGLTEQTWAWDPEERRYDVTSLHNVRCRHTQIATTNSNMVAGARPEEILVQVGAHEYEVARQIPGKYIEVRGSSEDPPAWAGIGTTSAIWSTMKMQAVAGNLVYLDRYGVPFLDIQIDDWSTDKERAIARSIIQAFGRDGGIIRPKNAKIEVAVIDGIQGSRNATSDVHARFVEMADTENAVLWNGAPYASQTGSSGSSYALAQEQGNVEFRLTLADVMRVSKATYRDWFGRWMRYNDLPGRTPILKIFVERIEDPQVAVEMSAKLAAIGYVVDPAQIQEMTGLNRAEDTSEAETAEVQGDD